MSGLCKDRVVPVSCPRDCGASCPLEARVVEGKIVSIKNSPYKGQYMQGCPKGFKTADVVYAEDRLQKPLIRTGERGSGQFREASWQEALDYTAERLKEITDSYGWESVYEFAGSAACKGAVHHSRKLTERFFSLAGKGRVVGAEGYYSSAAAAYTIQHVFGTGNVGLDPLTLFSSSLIILWGANISVTRFGNEYESIIREIKKKGVPVVVIDPRRSRSAERLGTKWIPVLPGRDSALMCGLIYLFLTKQSINREYISRYSTDFHLLENYVLGKSDGIKKTPEWASKICGTPVEDIQWLADLYFTSKPAALIPGLSMQRTLGGEEIHRLTAALQLLTENIGIKGGNSGQPVWDYLPSPRCYALETLNHPDKKRVPVNRWPDYVLNSDTRIIYNAGTNYLNQGSDINKSIRAFKKLDFIVTHDMFMTLSARYSDVILPIQTFTEHRDVIITDKNYLFYSDKAIEPLYGTKTDYEIYTELASRLGFKEEFTEGKTQDEWVDYVIENSEITDKKEFLKTGIYKGAEQERTGLSDFISDPEKNPLPTPSGKIELAAKGSGKGMTPDSPTVRISSDDKEYPFMMITPHSWYLTNSQNSNIPWFQKQERHELTMHCSDAKRLGLTQDDMVTIMSREGSIELPLNISEDIMPGVVSARQGYWHNPVNFLTSTESTLPCFGSRTHSMQVKVTGKNKKC